MSPLRAVLLFPVRPAAATRALRGGMAGWLAILPLPLLAGGYLAARGCAARDALAVVAVSLALELGLAFGGVLACYPAGLVIGKRRPVGDLVAPCCVFAAWACGLFPVVLGLAAAAGAGILAALVSGVVVLVWGIVAGTGLLAQGDEIEFGPGLVGSCAGVAGALLALFGVLLLSTDLVFLRRAPVPVEAERIGAGDLVLVAADQGLGAAGNLVFLEDRTGRHGQVLARVMGRGEYAPIEGVDANAFGRGSWRPVGRVFFRFDSRGGESVPVGRRRD